MKRLISLLLVAFATNHFPLFAGEIKVEPVIKSVTVFLDGAQILSEAKVHMLKGKNSLIFTGITTYMESNSLRVNGQGPVTILGVTSNLNYLEVPEDDVSNQAIRQKIKELTILKENRETELKILVETRDFLLSNKNVAGTDKSVDPNNLKLYAEFYSAKFDEVETKMLAKQREINDITERLNAYVLQSQAASAKKGKAAFEIHVEVNAESESSGTLNISYLISNAGWYPTYDLRVTDINHPVQLIYQANVHQNSGMDWKNVELSFSNANPRDNASIPILYAYLLNFANYKIPPVGGTYNPNIRNVSGVVVDAQTNEPVPFATVSVKDKAVGTSTDFNGKFELAIPEGARFLHISYVGYYPVDVSISQTSMIIKLEQSPALLQEVQVVDYKLSLNKTEQKAKPVQTIPLEISTSVHQTNFEYKINTPYSLPSSANPVKIDMFQAELTSDFIYKSVPKLSEKAFLIARLSNWEDYNLLDGEVNLYFENTFVGNTSLSLDQMSDTLEVSLGPDKNIQVKRELQKEFVSRQFLGGNKNEKRSWKITVKNNKSNKIKLVLNDQIPISGDQSISVEDVKVQDGNYDKDSGKVTWELNLDPNQTQIKTFEYSVKYPKSRRLLVQ